MKRILLFTAMLMIAFGAFAQYIDLGLPSGTKWKKTSEKGFYTYDEAMAEFATQLPSYAQLEELRDFCTWTWMESGCKVVGPNGNFIYLPAAGRRDCDGDVDLVSYSGSYWSSTPSGSAGAYYLVFLFGKVGVNYSGRCYGQSVLLVQN
ncbi:MAG: hypothetical protein IKL69_00095 [Paludibacteraceae bacterium]|nr:hypothetical protein [Paludibacteraceae bacterium]